MNISMKFMRISLSLVTLLFYIGMGSSEAISAGQLSASESSMLEQTEVLVSGRIGQAEVTPAGLSFDKGTTRVKLDNNTKTISVTNRNGTIELKQGSVKDIEVHTTVVVDNATTKEEAKAVANKAELRVNKGETLDIHAYSEAYGSNKYQYPSIHLTIMLPQTINSDLLVKTTNGNISLSKLTRVGKINLTSTNGNITANGIGNDIILKTTYGNVEVSDASKGARISVTNGNIQADRILGPLNMKATNGNLSSKKAVSSIEAATTTGNIHIESEKIGGDWNASTSTGKVYLAWPESAGVKVDGETTFGEIKTDFPLTIKDHTVTGKMGDGTFHIRAKSMAKLSLMKN